MNFVWEKDCLCSPLIHYNNLVFSLFCHFILFSHIPDITKNPNLASHKFHRWEPDNLKNRGHKRKGVNSVKINYAFMGLIYLLGFPNSSDEKKKITLQCRRPWFNTWVRKIIWRREWQLPAVFLLKKFHGQTMGLQTVRLTKQLTISLSHVFVTIINRK